MGRSLDRKEVMATKKQKARATAAGKEPPAKPQENPNAPMAASPAASAETMQPNAAKPPPQPLNIIQKTFRAEALARLQRGMIADCGFTERLVVFWSNHFCISANKGGLARMWASLSHLLRTS